MKPTVVVSVLIVCVLAVTGTVACSLSGRTQAALDESTVPIADIAAMAMDNSRKARELAQGFPFQVPVFGGRVDDAQVVSPGSVWAYEVTSSHPPAVVTEWYLRAYAAANWVRHRHDPLDDGGPEASVMYFSKGLGAESVVEIAGDGSGGTVVTATVALGASIRETY